MTSPATTERPRPTDSAKSVLLTMLGEFVAPTGGNAWTGSLVEGLAGLGFSDRNARQAVARLGDDGIMSPQRHGRKTRWQLTAEGDQLLRTGADRLYRFGADQPPWDGHWLIVICAVPEAQREKRRSLRTRLNFAGFGFLGPTIAVSPHTSAEEEANRILEALDLDESAVILRSLTGRLTPDGKLLSRSWDLDALSAAYDHFVDEFSTVQPDTPAAAFRDLTRLMHAWRQFPFTDPELPPILLPAGWVGNIARHLFADARKAWSVDATNYFKQLEAAHHH